MANEDDQKALEASNKHKTKCKLSASKTNMLSRNAKSIDVPNSK